MRPRSQRSLIAQRLRRPSGGRALVWKQSRKSQACWLFGWSAGIDRLLTPSLGAERPFAGRPAPQTALTFLLLGPALALLDRRPRRGPAVSELLVLIAMAVPILALLGYAYGVSHLYGVPILLPYTGMALPTAVTLIVLGAGVFFARPASGLMGVLTSPHAGGVAARRTLLALIALPLASFVVVLGVRQGLYPEGVGTGLVVFVALVDGLLLLLATSGHLERKDVALRQALAESEQRKLFFEHADWGAAISVESRSARGTCVGRERAGRERHVPRRTARARSTRPGERALSQSLRRCISAS